MAQVSFKSVWLSTAVNQQEESQSFAGGKIIGATNITFKSQDPAVTSFSGNNVPGNLVYTLNGVTYTVQGIVSRLFKSGNTYEGFYFVEAGSDYSLTSQEQTRAFILVWPNQEAAFPQSPGTYSTSSDPVDSALNSLLAAQPTLIGITQNEADLKLEIGQTWLYTISFSSDIDAATFTTSDLQNVGTAGVTFGTLTETSPGIFTLQVTATSSGTVKLAINNGTNISSPSGYSVSTSPQIIDDETLTVAAAVVPVISSVVAEDASTLPGSGDSVVIEGGTLRYVVTLSAAGTAPTQFSLSLSGNASLADYSNLSFSNGVTYDPVTGKITVPAGVTGFTVTAPTVDDNLIEATETLTVNVGGISGTGTIQDNDFPPVSVASISVNEASPYAVFSISGTAGQSVSLELQNDSSPLTNDATLGTDAGKSLQYFDGSVWVSYTGLPVTVPVGGKLLVRTNIIQDAVYEGPETFNLVVKPTGGVAATGTATILDDGTGQIYPDNNTGNVDPSAARDDDRSIQIDDILVNEASPYLVFNVQGVAGQGLTLSLQNDADSATANASLGVDSGSQIQYFNGLGWANYTGGTVAVPANGTLLVRTKVINDTTYEGAETLQLKVATAGGLIVYGTATIVDDGSGNVYPDNTTGNRDPNALLDDDRAIKVNDIDVNERSPYGVFTINANAGQQLTLGVQNDADVTTVNATLGVDTGTQLQYFNGSSWLTYSSGAIITVPASGQLLVRLSISNGPDYEGPETFQLSVKTASGSTVIGTATIYDDGTGTIYNLDGSPNLALAKDDDRTVKVGDIVVNEASPYAVFTVTGVAGQKVTLGLQNDTDFSTSDATLSVDTGSVLSYFDGSNWQNYTPGLSVTLPTSGQLLVRTTVVNDSNFEGAET